MFVFLGCHADSKNLRFFFVLGHCEERSDVAIHLICVHFLDCFATLAMTCFFTTGNDEFCATQFNAMTYATHPALFLPIPKVLLLRQKYLFRQKLHLPPQHHKSRYFANQEYYFY